MSLNIMDRLSPRKLARITGGVYLAFIVASVVADMLGHIGLGTPEQLYGAIVTNPGSFRTGFVIALLTGLLFLLSAWGLYVLLRPIDRDLALLFLLINAVGVAIQGSAMLSLLHALFLAGGAGGAQVFTATQTQGLALASLNVYKTGWVTAQLFFGAWLFPLGYLVYKSRFLPRFLGVLLLLDGIGVGIWFLQGLLWPDLKVIIYPGIAVSFLAEFGLALWLLIKGAKAVETEAGVARS